MFLCVWTACDCEVDVHARVRAPAEFFVESRGWLLAEISLWNENALQQKYLDCERNNSKPLGFHAWLERLVDRGVNIFRICRSEGCLSTGLVPVRSIPTSLSKLKIFYYRITPQSDTSIMNQV